MKRILLAILLAVLVAGCADKAAPVKDADYWLQEGEKALAEERYDEAIEAWEKARETFVSAEVNALAEIKIAEAHFLAKHYPEAAAAYEDFLRQHPDHGRTPEILYRLGLSYYQQVLSADRDQTATRSALVTFENLLRLYPDHPQTEEVQAFIRQCRDRLAEHEMVVGQFYLRSGHPAAAIARLEEITERFPDFSASDQVYFELVRSYLKAGQSAKAEEAFNTLAERFPESGYVSRAWKLLQEETSS